MKQFFTFLLAWPIFVLAFIAVGYIIYQLRNIIAAVFESIKNRFNGDRK